MRVLLIGLRGAGKTAVGARLARELRIPFHDSDAAVASRWGQSPGAIIRCLGEPEFRRREAELVRKLSQLPEGVLALGGGALEAESSRDALRSWATILLDAPDPVLAARIELDRTDPKRDRPPLTGLPTTRESATLRRRRWPGFLSMQPWVVDTSERSVEEIARTIAERLRETLASGEDRIEGHG